MAVEIFSKEQFEQALPMKKDGSGPAWRCLGFDKGEYSYLIGLGNKPAAVYVRSSVDQTGWSRATGKDSLRVFVVEAVPTCNACYRQNKESVKCEDRGNCFYCPKCKSNREGDNLHFNSLSGKEFRWTTRLPGWQERMTDLIRFMAEMAVKIDTCPKCKSRVTRLNKVKKAGPNKGRWFLSCWDCPDKKNSFFQWLESKDNDDDEDEVPNCPGCDCKSLKSLIVKKEGPNKGRPFFKCEKADCGYFQWGDENT